ncbi:MAG: 50S ribosomal protein L25 [Myxococcales bacterium]|nr:50S ribosomal protein L25 [Myxococcales bacterium]
MEPQTLNIETRDTKGKGAARQLRASGKVPGIFYGPGAGTTSIALSPKELQAALSGEFRRNTLLKISVGGDEHLALVKDLQIHPVSRAIRHVDLYKVELDRPVEVRVPFATTGRAKGVVAGGELNVVFRDLPVRSTPGQVPAAITVDVTNMDLNEFIKVKDLSLPEGVTVTMDGERNVVALTTARRRAAAEEDAEEGAEAPAEGAAAG